MNRRYTLKEVEGIVDEFMSMLDIPKARDCSDVGGWRLDYNPIYGGYVIEQIHNEFGGVEMPFGHSRKGAKELVETLWFARQAIRIMEVK